MDYSYIFKNYKLNTDNILKYGFTQNNDIYTYKKDLNDGDLYLVLSISNNLFHSKVYDKSLNEEYLPFEVKNPISGFTLMIQEEVQNIVDDVIDQCFYNDSMKDKVLNYVINKYNTIPEYPWKRNPDYCTLKTSDNKKWYGLIMNIPLKTLGIDKKEEVDVINIKLDPETIKNLVDHNRYFPAYHMNKKYWISIILDNTLEEDIIFSLIDESYSLSDKK